MGKPHLDFMEANPAPVVKTIHRCSVCGTEGHWSKDWSWFGSIRDIEDGNPVEKFCSDDCKEKSAQLSVEGARAS